MRVLVLTSSFPRFRGDSAGIFVYHLGTALERLGVDLEVLAPHHPGSERHETWGRIRISRFPYFYPLKLQRLCYGAGILKNMKESPMALMQLPSFVLAELSYAFRIAQKRKFDLVHAHWSIPQGLTAFFLSRLYKIPYVLSVHGSDVYGLRSPALRLLNKAVVHQADGCVANSNATATMASNVSGRRDISVIPMGVDVDLFKSVRSGTNGHTENGPNILYAGRLIDVKGVQYLIEALPRVLKMHPSAKLLIVGSGPLRSSLAELSERLHLQDQVKFIHDVPQEELVRYYSMADVFVLPSVVTDTGETEGLGVVLLEAMACGVPVIGSAIGGISDIIEDQETGLLVRQKTPVDLAEKINRVLADKELRQRLSKRGHDFVKERFSWPLIAKRYLGLFRSVLEEKGRGGGKTNLGVDEYS